MELSKINITGFYFRKSNCEWTVNHKPDRISSDFVFGSFDLETLTMSGTLASEQLSFWENYTPEPEEAVEELLTPEEVEEPEEPEEHEPEAVEELIAPEDPEDPEEVGPPIHTIVFTQEEVDVAKAQIT
tara:strand:+ start:147 stop:533 length:387 start_codon:yes stop_codon:yes gene_type:complete